ncbi:MAG: hypothetical protein HZA54_02995 [Planctomycetes bacterium]|nr:hypothetical protein [Planctomycetota bacterium]
MRPTRTSARRAMVLIVALGMLSILVVIATTFLTISGMEREASSNYTSAVRALMLAHSGVAFVQARLQEARSLGTDARYGGEDWNGNAALIGGPLSGDAQIDDANGNANGIVDFLACPLRFARRPSFFADENGDGMPDLTAILEGGRSVRRGYTGALQGTFRPRGDTYVVRLIDTSSLLYLNGAGTGYRTLYRNLCTLLFNSGALGDRIQAGQPYLSPEELVARGVVTPAQFDVLRNFVTAHAWVDRSTIKPDPQGSLLVMPERLRRLDQLEPRAPININGADPTLLTAAFLGISGYQTDNNRPNKSFYVMSGNRPRDLAQAIVAARAETFTDANGNGIWDPGEAFTDTYANGRFDGPFRTWAQFASFLSGVTGFVGNFNTPFRELALACATPNSNLNKFQPDASRYHGMDKSDLIVYTTELCLDATGYYEIGSYGRVTEKSGRAIAEKEIRCVLKLFETQVLTTQEDFEGAGVKVSIDPDVMTLPEEIADFATEAYTDTNADGRFSKGDAFVDSNGDGARDGPAIYDGQVTLRPADPVNALPWGDPGAMTFRALYNDSPNIAQLGRGDAYPSLSADTATPANRRAPLATGQTVTNLQRGGSLIKDLNGANNYSDLYPDGLFIRRERRKAIYYSPVQNVPPLLGAVGFWVKPTWRSIPSSIQYRDLLAVDQQFELSPNRGRIFLMYALFTGEFILEGLWYHDSYGTAARETQNDLGYVPGIMKCLYRIPIRGTNWNPGQWHYFTARWRNEMQFDMFLDGERSVAVYEEPVPPNTQIIRIGPIPTLSEFAFGSNMPWWDTIGSGTFDDLRVFRTLVPNTDIGLAPPWRFDDTGYSGYSTYVGKFPLPAGTELRTIGMTAYRPVANYRGDTLSNRQNTPRRRKPDVRLSYRVSSETGWHELQRSTDVDRVAGESQPVAAGLPRLAAGDSFQFKLTFERKGQDPFRNSPIVDDVWITYALGAPQFLSFTVLP